MCEPANAYPEQSQADTLILALGNPLRGDDGVGPAILEALRQANQLPPGVTLLDGGSRDLWTALLAEEYRRVIVVDAVEMGAPTQGSPAPGETAWFTACKDVFSHANMPGRNTLHDVNLPEALALREALNLPIPEIIVCGVQPLNVGGSEGLSEPVRNVIPKICDAILAALTEIQPRQERR